MQTVRARFLCHAVHLHAGGSTNVHMRAVYGSDPGHENRAFNDATPYGSFEIQIAPGKPAAQMFLPGRQYTLDIALVPEEPEQSPE